MLVSTFDLEPWWTLVPPAVPRETWDALPDRSEVPLNRFLDICDETNTRSTFFVVGEYARRFPRRIRAIADRGHEVGCHTLWHDDVALQSLGEFARETTLAREIIEDACGYPVIAFRAPSFSLPMHDLARFFQLLQECGFRIDSSLTSAARVYGGGGRKREFGRVFSLAEFGGVEMVEVGVPGVPLLGREITVFGGGYLRITPTAVASRALARSAYQVLYLHAHDFDSASPRIPGASFTQGIRRRLAIGDLYERVRRLLTIRRGVSCADAAATVANPSRRSARGH